MCTAKLDIEMPSAGDDGLPLLKSVVADEPTLVRLTSNYGPTDLSITYEYSPIGNDAN